MHWLTEVDIIAVVLFGWLELYFGKVLIEVDISAAATSLDLQRVMLHLAGLSPSNWWILVVHFTSWHCLLALFKLRGENVLIIPPRSFRYQTNDEMRALLTAVLVALLVSITSSSTSLHKQPAKQTKASTHLNSGKYDIIILEAHCIVTMPIISGGDVFEAGLQQQQQAALPSSVKLRHKGGIVLAVTSWMSPETYAFTSRFLYPLKFILWVSFCLCIQAFLILRFQDPGIPRSLDAGIQIFLDPKILELPPPKFRTKS